MLLLMCVWLLYSGSCWMGCAADAPLDLDAPHMIPQNFPGRCRREPTGVAFPKSPGDNGFYITISGNPDKYVPGELYTVTLQGYSSHFTVQKFVGFMLIVEPKRMRMDMSARPDVGSFQLFGNAMVKYSEECPNAIVHASLIPKQDIKVKWEAPHTGSGCIVFKATVQENKERWYMDEGQLIRELCEEEEENRDKQVEILEKCCACDEAKYELTFEGLWSRQTHPKYFPTNEWLTKFSDIIGASHTNDFRIWEYKEIASEGVKELAETGVTKKIESELKIESDKIRTIIKARGLWYPNTQGRTFAIFRVDKHNHLVSLLTTFKPSPDWIVGVSALELCLQNCSWAAERVMNLYPWDAGTDSGITYISPKMPTYPQEKTRRITSSSPNNPESPFYDASGVPLKPVARLTVRRQRIYEKPCDDMAAPTIIYPPTNEENNKSECRVTDWTIWTQCSVICGQGHRMRTRQYYNKVKADNAGCTVPLIEKQTCTNICDRCSTTEWSEWSECSVTCGKGLRIRKRNYIDVRAGKTCALDLLEKETCIAMKATCEDDPRPESECAVTHWSEWSPCMVTCGKGLQIRTRLYLNPAGFSVCNVLLKQEAPCNATNPECTVSITEAKKNCMQPQEVGPCRGYFPRWYYDTERSMCSQFIYGGCKGNRNNFERYIDCNRMCETMLRGHQSDLWTSPAVPEMTTIEPSQVIDCEVTPWSEWTACTATCGHGRRERRRMIKLNPKNGGKPCPTKLVQRRKCKEIPPCYECRVSDWTIWTQCSVTCGQGHRMRTRQYYSKVEADMAECRLPLIEKQTCSNICDRCRTTEWSEWSECSVMCGKGLRIRKRNYLDITARKTCSVDLMEKETCIAIKPTCEDDPMPESECAVTYWSEWSPCMVTCGKGLKLRTRLYLKPRGALLCNVKLKQVEPCTAVNPDCTVSITEDKKNCMQPRKAGPCRGFFIRFYYDVDHSICRTFIYGGCEGNKNNFEQYMDCKRMCETNRV